MEHTFPNKDTVKAFDDEMARRTAKAKGDEHYQNLLARIGTRDKFRAEMIGKIKAIKESGYPIPVEDKHIDELISILLLDTVGDPPFWPPQV